MSNIDDIFKNNLDNNGIKYSDAYWDDMEKMLDKNKRKRFFLWTGIIAMAFLGLLLSAVFFFVDEKPLKKQESTSIVHSQQKQGGLATRNESIANDSSATVSNEGKTTSIALAIEKPVEVKLDTKVTASHHVSVEKPHGEMLDLTDTRGATDYFIATNVPEDVTELKPLKSIKRIDLAKMALENPLVDYKPIYIAAVQKPIISTENKDSSIKETKWQFYLASSYEYDLYNRASNKIGLKENEKTMDKSGYNFNFIARKKSWGIKSGVGLLQLSELTNYITTHKTYEFNTNYRMINANYSQTAGGTKIALIKKEIDTTMTSSSFVQNPDSKVNFTYFKMPLMATYQFMFKRFGMYTEAGINACFLMQKNGSYTSIENNQYVVRDVKKSNDFNKVLFQPCATIGLKYRIAKSFGVYGGYGIARSLSSMTKSYAQKPNINLFTFGLEIKL